jgi:hypothetical protein
MTSLVRRWAVGPLVALAVALLPVRAYAYDDEDFHPCFTSGARHYFTQFYVGPGSYKFIEWWNTGSPHYTIYSLDFDRYCSNPAGCNTSENGGLIQGNGYAMGAEILGYGDIYFTFYSCYP